MEELGPDIIPICDIRLGELFRANPELEGKYIDIDTLAIKSIIKHINPESTDTILFSAVHDDTLNKNQPVPITEGTTRKPLLRRFRPDKPTRVSVTIGGSEMSFPGNISAFLTEYYTQNSIGRKRLYEDTPIPPKSRRNSGKQTYRGRTLDVIAKDTGVIQDIGKVQETVVHELCHASDSPEEEKADRRATNKAYLRFHGKYFYGAVFAGNVCNLTPIFTDVPSYIGATGLIGSYAILVTPIYKSQKVQYKTYIQEQRPTEAKAYAMHEHAAAYPHVISFKDID